MTTQKKVFSEIFYSLWFLLSLALTGSRYDGDWQERSTLTNPHLKSTSFQNQINEGR